MKCVYWMLWPSFLAAVAAEVLLIAFVDPRELCIADGLAGLSLIGFYSLIFFVTWAVCSASCATSCYLQTPSADVNRSAASTSALPPH